MLDTQNPNQEVKPFDGMDPLEYFAYDEQPFFDERHLSASLKIADPIAADSAIYVLNPQAVAEDGEWEAWIHAHWIPGAERYPSFAHLMLAQYESFRITVLKQTNPRRVLGPFDGVYAPDRPRRAAARIGPGKRRPRRLSVEELIGQLEDVSAKVRLDSAKQLFREYKPHQPENERPELVPRLTRILRSKAEQDVRCAAACMLGSYGDQSAIDPLVAALDDSEVARMAVSALHYLSLYMKDTRIADGLCHYLAFSTEPTSTGWALNILEDFADVRLASFAIRILDSDVHWQLRSQAAFALAASSASAVDQLIARLTHDNSEIRTAAAAALRATKDQRAIEPLSTALNDPDPNVRAQAEMSILFLKGERKVPDADVAEAQKNLMTTLRALGYNLPE